MALTLTHKAALVFLAGLALRAVPAHAYPTIADIEGPFPVNVQACPPGDGNSWYQDRRAARRVYWVEIEDARAFVDTCGSAAMACTTEAPDGTAIVYARMPRERYSESVVAHEECHAAGWSHGPQSIGNLAR